MKKSTKLLSVLLAVVMIFSSLSVMASAYQAYDDSQEAVYTSNDTGLATLLTDEQRASWFCDLVNSLLAQVNIYQSVPVIGTIDFRNLDAVCDSIDNLKGWIGFAGIGFDLGIFEDLNYDGVTSSVSISNAVNMLNVLIQFVDNNVGVFGDLIGGELSFGILAGAIPVDLNTINPYLKNLDSTLKGLIYGLGARKLTNGIGDDPAWPNDPLWDDLGTKPTLDSIVQDLIIDLLTTPRHTESITDPSQNLICTNPTAYGATAAMIHSEPAVDSAGNPVLDDDGNQVTWYYIYGTQDSSGNWKFTESTTLQEADKNYISHWAVGSSLLKNFDTSVVDFNGKSLYELVGSLLPWAYDTFGAPNLDGQLRATLMQFCGAYNKAETNTAITDQLKAKVKAYQNTHDANGANGAAIISDQFDATVGEAGNYNFQYISLSGADINTMPDDLYYVVQWGDGWEFYHVDFSGITGEGLNMFQMINWEYQAPSWAEIMPTGHDATTTSSLRNITDAIGKILEHAVNDLTWTYDSASEDNAHFEDNIMGLVRRVLKLAPNLIYGKNDAYKAESIDSQTDEQLLTVLGADIMEWLMPALVLPEDVSCLEELIVYGLREFIAEILPEYKWEDQIAAATTDADYLNIALDMGTSIGVYYLRNVMALGTKTDGNGNTSVDDISAYLAPSADCAAGWQAKLNYVVDQVIAMWLPDLSAKVVSRNSTVFSGTDGMLKLTCIFNTLFPGILSLISGCEGNGFAVDLAVVKDLIAGLLNLEVEPIAAKLYRNDTGYGNKSVYNAVVNLLIDLTTGIGFDDSNDYANLVSNLNTALAQTAPLDYLVTNANLKVAAKNLLWSITDTNTRDLWVQNLLLLLMQLTGQMDDMSLQGIAQSVDQNVYRGSATATVTPSVMLDTSGLKSVFYTTGYRTGTFTQDAAYSGVLQKYEILDVEGNVVNTVDGINATLAPNQAYTGTTITCPAADDMALYTLKTYVVVTMPDGSQVNDGEPMVTTTNFMTTSKSGGDDDEAATIRATQRVCNFYLWNIYIDENTSLDYAATLNMKMENTYDSTIGGARMFYINGYGANNVAADGSITVSGATTGAAQWKVTTTNGTVTTYNHTDGAVPFYWRWNDLYGGTEITKQSTQECQQWLVDTKNFSRASYEAEDITVLEFTSSNYKLYYYNSAFTKGTESMTVSPSPYIVIYNTYGLQAAIQSALNANRVKEDYTADSWATYVNALKAAIAEFYMTKTASTFITDHTTGGVSDYKTCYENLKAAIEGLVPVADTETQATDYTAEEKAVLATLKSTLDAQADKTNLNNKNYIMYRWLKYYNEYAWLNNIYNGSVIPSGVAQNDLSGVPSDNAVISSVIAAAPADKQAAINLMVVAPTADETAAAARARADFLANLPTIDVSSIQVDMKQMAQYETRLIARTPTTNYLALAYNSTPDQTSAAEAAKYTAESWAKYYNAKQNAYNVALNGAATPAEIHEARYDLLVAYKGLIPVGTDVDLTALEDVMTFVDTIFANPDLFQPTEASGLATLDEALALVLAEAGVKVTVDDDTYYVGGGDTGAAWLDEAGLRTAIEAQDEVDRVVKEIKEVLANIESTIMMVPDESVAGNTTEVQHGGEYIVDGINPGTINSAEALLALVTTNAPAGYTANLAVNASAANGFGTGTKVVLTVAEVPSLVFTHTVMVYGDVNGDGAIDAFDAALINQNIAGATTLTGDFATAAQAVVDDGVINLSDYSAVAAYTIGEGAIAQTR